MGRPPCSDWIYAFRWLRAAFITTRYGLPEFAFGNIWRLLRIARSRHESTMKTRFSKQIDQWLDRTEHNCLKAMALYRKKWGQSFLKCFHIHTSIRYEGQTETQTKTHIRMPIIHTQRPMLFVQLNQTSIIEIPLVAAYNTKFMENVPGKNTFVHYLCNSEFAMLPFIGWNRAITGVTLVRNHKRQTRRAVDKMMHRMQHYQDNFFMSIEGQRSKDGYLNTYKNGAALIAISTKALLTPVMFEGCRAVWPYGDWRVSPGNITIVILPVVDAALYHNSQRHELTQRLRATAEAQLPLHS